MSEEEFSKLVSWLREDVKRLFKIADHLENSMATHKAVVEHLGKDFASHVGQHTRSADRWWAVAFRLLGQAALGAGGVLVTLIFTGNWPF